MPNPETESIPNLVTVKQLAERWGIPADTLRAWARSGKLPSVKLGKMVMFEVGDLCSVTRAHRRGSQPVDEDE